MKKILLVIVLSLFFIPGVNASTRLENPLDCFSIASPSSTKNMFSNSWGTADNACSYVNGYWSKLSTEDTGVQYYCINNFIEVEPGTTYTLTHFNSSFSPVNAPLYNRIYYFDESFNRINDFADWFSPPFNFTTPSNIKYILYCSSTSFKKLPVDVNIQLEKGPISNKDDLSYVAYEKYVETPDEPEDPIVPDTTLDSFYSIYLSKLQLLTQYAVENKFLLSAIGIILLFVILEIILNLFRKGGYR